MALPSASAASLGDEQGAAFVLRGGEQILRRHHARHGLHDGSVEDDVVHLKVDEVVAPALEAGVEMGLHRCDDLTTERENLGLALGGDEATDRAFHRTDHGLAERVLVDELERDVHDGALALVERRVEQHGLEVHVRLVERDGLERDLGGAVLHRHHGVHALHEGHEQVESRIEEPTVLTERGDHRDGALIDRAEALHEHEQHEQREQDDERDDDFHASEATHPATPSPWDEVRFRSS